MIRFQLRHLRVNVYNLLTETMFVVMSITALILFLLLVNSIIILNRFGEIKLNDYVLLLREVLPSGCFLDAVCKVKVWPDTVVSGCS